MWYTREWADLAFAICICYAFSASADVIRIFLGYGLPFNNLLLLILNDLLLNQNFLLFHSLFGPEIEHLMSCDNICIFLKEANFINRLLVGNVFPQAIRMSYLPLRPSVFPDKVFIRLYLINASIHLFILCWDIFAFLERWLLAIITLIVNMAALGTTLLDHRVCWRNNAAFSAQHFSHISNL